ncbi:MAG: 2,3-bisphosphoglycerate-independent phosphoglycerate mutase [Leptospiraceae bacterium]|nr:2,3-bisphosphoglycerate-independent phosphoglycerate mutase [Leptospiraceae bacterium]MCK6380446.1 2,3-bisphosphoglycerate-independent phosphoglycerate mutase [Leptospiraceae bacterium]NUM43001.1 2,3-bisphosphoglycerate-independent phosphoglycerate mutase [Leptospiraceae bacterium]
MKLKKKFDFEKPIQKVLLIILDGVGYSPKGKEFGNAVAGAKLPTLNSLWSQFPTVLLKAHGKAVGMPSDEDMGNSEVGHNVLGCGRVFDQGAKLVSNAIHSGTLFLSDTWNLLTENSRKNNSTFHFIGLLSDGNVHSHIDHLKEMLIGLKKAGVKKSRIHILLDGRDVPESSALEYVLPFEKFLSELNNSEFDARIASGGGRMTITMDRYEADWSMVERGWKIHVLGEGRKFYSAEEAIETFRKEGEKVIDQYLPGFVVSDKNGNALGKIQDKDSVVYFNFRGDRAIEICRAFTEKDFTKFDRIEFPKVEFAGMMQYDGDLKIPEKFLVTPPLIDRTMGEYFASNGVRQYAISETQKYGHVTYFWNGNRSGHFNEKLEDYEEIPSDIISFDKKPYMKAKEITDALVAALRSDKFDFLRVNYPNGDMVGHTGNFQATMDSLEFLDSCIGRLVQECEKTGTSLLITADHGNSDEMYQLDKKGNVVLSNGNPVAKTSHTLNPVRLTLIDKKNRWSLHSDPENGLANIASTIMEIMGFEPPSDYAKSLLQSKV